MISSPPTRGRDDLGQVWDAANHVTKEIAGAAGLSQRKPAEHFMIPYRTMEGKKKALD